MTIRGTAALVALALLSSPPAAYAQDPVRWTIARDKPAPVKDKHATGIDAGAKFDVRVNATIEDGWHVYATTQTSGGPVALNFDIPKGGPFSFGGPIDEPLPQLYRLETPEPVPPRPTARPIGAADLPLYEIYNRQAQGMLFSRAILDDAPYPLRALVLFGSNPLVTSPDGGRMAEAARRLELLVTVDPFLSESARQSHYVLPSATFVLQFSQLWSSVSSVPTIAPVAA